MHFKRVENDLTVTIQMTAKEAAAVLCDLEASRSLRLLLVCVAPGSLTR
jgi:hypothetical protein